LSIENNVLNLRSVPCPLNVVKCKLALQKLDLSGVLLVELDLGEPEVMVKQSLEKEGYKCKIIKREKDHIVYSVAYEHF
tara:strand:+ start:141 stop:377 length:237 start_codon:yes stop_codon:yes gene_type:complete